MKRIKQAQDMPADTTHVLLVFKQRTIAHEGDERSRTAPGHGYAAWDETVNICEVYARQCDEADFQYEVEALYAKSPNIVVLNIASASRVHSRVVIEVEKLDGRKEDDVV